MKSTNNHKIVGLTFDVKEDYVLKESEPEDKYAEFDSLKTIGEITKAIEDSGHKVVSLGNAQRLLRLGKKPDVDIVFNIAEGLGGRNRESQVPMLLELMDIPYVGADALTLGVTLDKIVAKQVFIAEGIPTPEFFQAKTIEDLKNLTLKFPLMVKPRYEGSSKGVDHGSLVRDESALEKRVSWLIEKYQQPALIEEFILGKEFTVPIIGNDPPKVYYPVQVEIEGKLELGDLFYTHGDIYSPDLEYVYPAQISKDLTKRIQNRSLAAYRAVGCRDWGRVDVRVNEKDEIFILELNPLPSLCSEDVFIKIAEYEGLGLSDIVGSILNAALKRYSMLNSKEKVASSVKN